MSCQFRAWTAHRQALFVRLPLNPLQNRRTKESAETPSLPPGTEDPPAQKGTQRKHAAAPSSIAPSAPSLGQRRPARTDPTCAACPRGGLRQRGAVRRDRGPPLRREELRAALFGAPAP